MKSRCKGLQWEKAAESFLRDRGLKTLERNFYSRFGEIDIVMSDGRFLVFVEVKYRRRKGQGNSAERVDFRKRQRIAKAANHYLACHPRQGTRPCRFDVVAIDGEHENRTIDWIKNAFETIQG